MIQLNGQIITASDTMNYIHKDKIANDDFTTYNVSLCTVCMMIAMVLLLLSMSLC